VIVVSNNNTKNSNTLNSFEIWFGNQSHMVKQDLIKTIIDNDKTYNFTKNKRNTYLVQLVLVM